MSRRKSEAAPETPKTIRVMSRGGDLLKEIEADDLRTALIRAVSNGADLTDADLKYADLRGADLSGADLRSADLRSADLRNANLMNTYLTGADLTGAYLSGANLMNTYLSGAVINWQSHTLIAELLKRAAGKDIEKRKIAGLIAISTDWCWEKFLVVDDPLRDWAIDTLAPWVKDGDGAPSILRDRKAQEAAR